MRQITLNEILDCLGSQVLTVDGCVGEIIIDNLADTAHVNDTTLDWVNQMKSNKQEIAECSKAKVLLVDESISPIVGKVLIKVKNPKVALAMIGNNFFVQHPKPGIHPTAIVDANAEIGDNVSIGPYSVIGKVTIGNGCEIDSNVRIYDNVIMGKHCRVKAGAVLGGEGFGFERDDEGNRFRFPQIGGLRIGDYVEIGANTSIDRGALSDTIIEDYVKISNLCQIAHNVRIGKNVIITACVEISGSCKIGTNTWVGPNACIRDQRNVGSNTLIGMGSVVVKNIGDNEIWAGNPAKLMRE